AALRARFGRHWRDMAALARVTRRYAGPAGGSAAASGPDARASGPDAAGPGLDVSGGRGRRLVAAALAAGGRDQRVFDDLAELGLAEGPLTARAVRGLLLELLRSRGSRPASP
ncbi:MAG: hypothetical protein ACXV3A_02260, partial [Kineosporiaceae bacterium]